MRAFSAGELSRMQGTQERAMMDTCLHLARTRTRDRYNQDVETFTPALSYRCGFDPDPSREGMDEAEVAMVDAALRSPISVDGVIGTADRVQITHRFGVALDISLIFEVIGLPERGPSGLVFKLKKVTE